MNVEEERALHAALDDQDEAEAHALRQYASIDWESVLCLAIFVVALCVATWRFW